MAPVVAEFQRICETCRNPFITAVRYPSIRPRRTCSRSCAARLPRRHQPLSERFWRYVTRTPTCWLWTGLHTPNGAGVIPVREQGRVRRMTAAQVAWELHVGPIPAGRRVWRRCRRPACVRPDHLVLVRRGQPSLINDRATGAQTETPVRAAGRGHSLSGRADGRRAWWTRERVLTGLVAFHAATGQAPTTSIAVTLRRGEAAVRTRARKLGLHVGLAHGWPLLRVARTAGISEYVLRDYVDRGEIPVFKGAKHVYLDPADLPAVKEIDCQHLPSELESAVLRSLRWRLVRILAGQDWRTMQPHHLHQRENRRPR